MGNYFQFIKNNTLSCFGNTMFQNVYTFIASNLPKKFLNTPNGDSNFSESVSLLIEEDDVPPGFLQINLILFNNK